MTRDRVAGHHPPQLAAELYHRQRPEGRRPNQPLGRHLDAGHGKIIFDELAARHNVFEGLEPMVPGGVSNPLVGILGPPVGQGFEHLEPGFDLTQAGLGLGRFVVDHQGQLVVKVCGPVVVLLKGGFGLVEFLVQQGFLAARLQGLDFFPDLGHARVVGGAA